MDLDEKLDLILQEFYIGHDINHNSGGEAIAAIKQAFEDEIMPMVNHIDNLANDALTKAENLMTGSEWYERFEKEANKIPDDQEISTTHGADGLPTAKQLALKLAKRASGIDKEATKNGK